MTRYAPVPLACRCFQPEAGVEGKPPIIFLHGVTASKEHWQNVPQEVANATQRRAYVIDARNHGDSEWNDVFNFDCNVDDLLHFMDYIGAPKASIVGHSMGGITGIKTALRAPERVEKLAVEDMYSKRLPQYALDFVLKYVYLVKAAVLQVPVEADEWKAKNFISDYILDQLPAEVFMGRKELTKRDPSAVQLKKTSDGKFCYKSNIDVLEKAMEDSETLMTEITGEYHGPATFIYGTFSPFKIGEEEENIRKSFPNAEFVKIEDATHDVHTDQPKKFIKSLVEFLSK